MKLFTKVMAAALLSTALSGASMATDLSTLDKDLGPDALKAALHMVTTDGLNVKVTFSADLVDSISKVDPSTKFSNVQCQRLFGALKALYGELEVSAGDADKLKKALAGKTIEEVLNLNPAKPDADYKKARNTDAISRLKLAVVDDPFVAIKAAAKDLLALKDTPSAARKTDNAKYATVAAMITAFEAAEADVKDPSKKDAALKAAKDIVAEMAALKIGKAARRDLPYLAAKESKADFGVSDVRAAKSAALKKAVHVPTPEEETAIAAYTSLLSLVDSGDFGLLGMTTSGSIKADKAKAVEFLKLLKDSISQKVDLEDEIDVLKKENATLKARLSGKGTGSGSDQGQGSGGSSGEYPALDGISEEHRAAVMIGAATYDPATGVFRANNGSLTHQY